MAQPTYAQWMNLTTAAVSLTPQTVVERLITAFATIITSTNPDGTTFTIN